MFKMVKHKYLHVFDAIHSTIKLQRILKIAELRMWLGLRAGNTSKHDFRVYYDNAGLTPYELDALWYAFRV